MANILFIGPTLNSHRASIGGTTISFETLLEHARSHAQPHSYISVNVSRFQWLSALLLLVNALWRVPLHDVVMLNANPRGALILAPLLSWYTRLWRKRYVFRMFGGDLIEIYQESPEGSQRRMRRSIFGADRVYLQTQRMIDFFNGFSSQIRWLPTSRVLAPASPTRKFQGKLVYIGQIRQHKGLDLILQLLEQRADIQLAIYGPILEEKYNALTVSPYYHGVLAPDEVSRALAEHDVLLLPTTHPGEGYPGIIIEAFAAGLPVIATDWLAIPELVHHNINGRLIQPHSFDSLRQAVNSITLDNYATLSANALKSSRRFDANTINARLLEDLNSLTCQNEKL